MLSPTPGTSYRRPNDPPHWPPTPEEGVVDVESEHRGRDSKAREISASIDRALAQERADKRKADPVVKLLLVGAFLSS